MIELLTTTILVSGFVWDHLVVPYRQLHHKHIRLTKLLEDMEDKEQHDLAQIAHWKKEAAKWKEYWFMQREITGKSYWNGVKFGQKSNDPQSR